MKGRRPSVSLTRLRAQAQFAWLGFAPAVLEAGGDPAREDAALQRPGVAAAHALYLAIVDELGAEERRTQGEAMLDQRELARRITDALDWAA